MFMAVLFVVIVLVWVDSSVSVGMCGSKHAYDFVSQTLNDADTGKLAFAFSLFPMSEHYL